MTIDSTILSTITNALLVPAIPILATYAGKFLNAHIKVKNQQFVLNEVRSVVSAVEQLYKSGQISKESRLTQAIYFLQNKFPKQADQDLHLLIEDAVDTLSSFGTYTPIQTSAPAESPAAVTELQAVEGQTI